MGNNGTQETEAEILTVFAATMILVETSARAIYTAMEFALPKRSFLKMGRVDTQTTSEAIEAAALFLVQLRHRAAIEAEFDSLLPRFHDLKCKLERYIQSVPDVDLTTPGGRAVAELFFRQTAEIADTVTLAFVAVTRSLDITDEIADRFSGITGLKEVEVIYVPRLHQSLI